MGLIREFRARARHVVGPVLGVLAIGYFAFHAVHGDRGLIAWNNLKLRVEAAQVVLDDTSAERRVLERRVRLLNPRSLDPDMLDERARLMLNVGRDDEIVIFARAPKNT
jgi:cell division protein FtsB